VQIWEAIVLGLVEGITEYLPVSSTGHLILTSAWLGLDTPEQKSAVDAFNIVIQGGAIAAVAGLYWTRIMQMLRGLTGSDLVGRRLLLNLIVAFVPAALLGPLLDDTIETHLFRPVPVLAALFLGGVWMIWLDRRSSRGAGPLHGLDDMKWQQALVIGLFQCVAMWPGTSRSMVTIAGGSMLGLRPREAAEFSFLLGLPTLGGACVYKLLQNLRDSARDGTPNLFESLGFTAVIVGFVVAAIAAAFAVRWLVSFLSRHGLGPFGWYRIALCIVLAAWIASGTLQIQP